MKSTTSSRGPDCFQKIPRRIVLSLQQPGVNFQLLSLAVDAKGIHTILKYNSKIHYGLFNLSSGRQEQDSVFPSDVNSFMGMSPRQISLTCASDTVDSMLLLRDGNSAIYPLAKDCLNAIRDPQLLDFPPIRSIATITVSLPMVDMNQKSQLAVVVMAPERQILMPRILRCDFKGVKAILGQLDNGELKHQISIILNERCDGNRNIFHACISMCAPTTNKDNDQEISTSSSAPTMLNNSSSASMDCMNVINNSFANSRPVSIRDMMRRANQQGRDSSESGVQSNVLQSQQPPLPTHQPQPSSQPPQQLEENSGFMPVSFWEPEYNPYSGDEDSMTGITSPMNTQPSVGKQPRNTINYISDSAERRENALPSLAHMCSSTALQPHIKQLLSGKDGQGQTPFMLAVSVRAYQAARILFDVIMELAGADGDLRDAMIFPPGSNADQSPLYVLCCNDTCSFTWTGAVHINQDIFECRTCGLVGTLCCCTECAKVCHKGHDCKLKRTSPTAYCDCCEKCKCKALISGNQKKRFELFSKLASDTDLVTRFNSRGESILLFLIQTVGRQLAEQSQYTSSSRVRSNTSNSRKTPSLDVDSELQEHNLEPPRFAKKAIGRLLTDWAAVRSMILTGVEKKYDGKLNYEDGDPSSPYLKAQSGTTLLDKFTHSLLVCCSQEPLDTLLSTFVRELQNDRIPGRIEDAQHVTRRFIRSVARVFVIFSIERIPVQDEQKILPTQLRNFHTCRRVFQTLIKVSVEELCETADALIAPVRMGVVRPTAPFTLSANNSDNSDDVFSVEPLAPPINRRDIIQDSHSGNNGDQMLGFMSRINVRMRDMDDQIDDGNGGQDDGEISEQEDIIERDSGPVLRSVRNIDEVHDSLRNDEPIHEESDPEFNFQEAETESDSDDNQSTQDAQRSVQTGATAGSDTGKNGISISLS